MSYDDPIVSPGQPEAAHLHMFFGNTAVDAHTTTDLLVNTGGGTCQGQELNRTGYWVPALLDAQGNARVPYAILVHYKTRKPEVAQRFPQGLQIIAGEFTGIGSSKWSCGSTSPGYNISKTIPSTCNSDVLNATIDFPQCWDGVSVRSDDNISHMKYINDQNDCPSSHPVRLPQIQELLYWDPGDYAGWRLSSDGMKGTPSTGGGTLHADWYSGWHDFTMDQWTNNCIRLARNCSGGQLGTGEILSQPGGGPGVIYTGPKVLDIPE